MLAYCASKSREKCIKHLLKSCMKRVKGPWFFVVAIPNHQKGRWVELNGDGGYINWQFDPEAFHRIGNRIILK
ncbi:hypothetical protein L0F63_001731 [Massospora cicadina]|nr:hypothetical protein L0F63_001731 [Massospora cicadina]